MPGGGRGPGLRTPCASSLLLKSLVAGVTLDQATRALDGSCSGAGLASCSSAVEGMLGVYGWPVGGMVFGQDGC